MQGITADRGLVVDKMGCGQEQKIHTKEMRGQLEQKLCC